MTVRRLLLLLPGGDTYIIKQISMTLQAAFKVIEGRVPVEDPTVKARLNRAYDIVRQNGQGYHLTKSNRTEDSIEGYIWHIHKASTAAIVSGEDSSAFYTVDSGGCNCPDAIGRARAKLCKHKLATMIMLEMQKDSLE